MRRILIICLVLYVFFSCAAAESIDISGLSFDQLVELKDRINLAMWESQEWQEVTVPQGLWEVGKDIPEGSWSIRCATDNYAEVYYGDEIGKDGVSIKITQRFYHEEVVSPNYRRYEAGVDRDMLTITVRKGDYIVIDRSSVIFMPYTGKPDLGFR